MCVIAPLGPFSDHNYISLPLHIPEMLEVVKLLPFQVNIPCDGLLIYLKPEKATPFGRSPSVLAITGTIPRGIEGKGYQPPLSHSMKCVQQPRPQGFSLKK